MHLSGQTIDGGGMVLDGKVVKDFLETKYFAVEDDLTLAELFSCYQNEPFELCFLKEGTSPHLQAVAPLALFTSYLAKAKNMKVKAIAEPVSLVFEASESAIVASRRFSDMTFPYAAVVEDGKLCGFVTKSKIAENFMQSQFSKEQENKDYAKMIGQRDDYLAIVSHDIRSPLGVISVACDYLTITDKGPHAFSEEQKDFIARIKRNAVKALSLVASLLDIGRLNSGVSMDLEAVVLPPYLRGIVDNMQVLASTKNIQIEILELSELEVLLDPKRFAQVIENLVSNAIKFTPKDKKIYVSCQMNPGGLKDHVAISIRDEGYGIPSRKINELFEKYKQDDAHIAKELGVGLGLSIARQFTHLHRGWIEVKSAEGEGSTFTVVLPNAALSQSKIEKETKKMKVLVVEDDGDILEYIKDHLEEHDIQVYTATDGEKAIDLFKLVHPDLIISDLKMPNSDGFEMIQKIHLQEHKVPLVLTTGYLGPAHLKDAKITFKADLVLAKPFDEEDLLSAVHYCIDEYNLPFKIEKKLKAS